MGRAEKSIATRSRAAALAALALLLVCGAACKDQSPKPASPPSVAAPAVLDAAPLPRVPPPIVDVVPSPPPPAVVGPPRVTEAVPPIAADVPSPSDAALIAEPFRPAAGEEAAEEFVESWDPDQTRFGMMTGGTDELDVAEITLCRGIENGRCSEPTRVFAPGERVWVLLKISNTATAERRVLVSYVEVGEDPPAGRGIALAVPVSSAYTAVAKSTKTSPGLYDVVVRDEQENALGRATFQVR